MEGERGRVHDTLQINVQRRVVRLLQVAILIQVVFQQVCSWADTGVGKDMIDATVYLHNLFESGTQTAPRGDIERDV